MLKEENEVSLKVLKLLEAYKKEKKNWRYEKMNGVLF